MCLVNYRGWSLHRDEKERQLLKAVLGELLRPTVVGQGKYLEGYTVEDTLALGCSALSIHILKLLILTELLCSSKETEASRICDVVWSGRCGDRNMSRERLWRCKPWGKVGRDRRLTTVVVVSYCPLIGI